MAQYNSAVLTQKGAILLAKLQSGSVDGIEFTKAATGDGTYSPEESLATKTALKSQKQTFTFDAVARQEDSAVLNFTVTNYKGGEGLATGYYIKEVGVFATDPDDGEILYALATAVTDRWDYVPAYDGVLPVTSLISFVTSVTSSANVTLVADSTDYVTQAQHRLDINGFIGKTATFNADGTIDETDLSGYTRHVVFSGNVITETYKDSHNVLLATKTTTIGSSTITEVIS